MSKEFRVESNNSLTDKGKLREDTGLAYALETPLPMRAGECSMCTGGARVDC